MSTEGSRLDEAVASAADAIDRAGICLPRALYLLATGGGLLPLRLARGTKSPLARFRGVPQAWKGATLYSGELAGTPVWIVEDAPGAPEAGNLPAEDEPTWIRGFPCWLAAAAGASLLIHASAGTALVSGLAPEIEPGSLAFASDHMNLSGRSPLAGLVASRLGPLFPDLSSFHHDGLRANAIRFCAERGIPASEAVVACSPGPALETPAERRFYARAGAQVCVQGLEGPLLAAAHAGLRALAVVCVTDRGEEAADLAKILARAETTAPMLEEVLAGLGTALGAAADRLEGALETDA